MEFNKLRSALSFTALLFVIVAGVWALDRALSNREALGPVEGSQAEVSLASPVETPHVLPPAISVAGTAVTAHSSERAPASVAEKNVLVLEAVLARHNDNDPRLDHELRVLDSETKDAFRAQYDTIAVEDRNARGTIVFLLGRNLTEKKDVDFLRKVLVEAPCKSLENCEAAPVRISHEDPPNEMVLNYPQAVALTSIEAVLKAPLNDPNLRNELLATAREGAKSKAPVISRMGEKLLARLGN